MINLTPVINAVIVLLAALVTAFAVPWIRAQTTAAQRRELAVWIRIAVAAAEQLYEGSGRGVEKKQYVLDFLARKGFAVDIDIVTTLLEAAVQQLNSAVGLTIE